MRTSYLQKLIAMSPNTFRCIDIDDRLAKARIDQQRYPTLHSLYRQVFLHALKPIRCGVAAALFKAREQRRAVSDHESQTSETAIQALPDF